MKIVLSYLPSLAFNSQVSAPRDKAQIDLLTPPEVTSFLCYGLQRVAIVGCIMKPSDNVNSSRMFTSSKSSFVTENTIHKSVNTL